MVLYPAVELIRASFNRYSITGLFQRTVGFENYARALWGGNDPATQAAFKSAYTEPFWQALSHNFLIIVASNAL